MLIRNSLVGMAMLFSSVICMADGVAQEPTSDAAKSASTTNTPKDTAGEFYTSDKAARFRYEFSSERFNFENGRIQVGFLLTEERDNVISVGLALDTIPNYLPGFQLSYGGKILAGLLGIENADVIGIALGLEAGYKLPIKQFPLQLGATVYYAPDILTFGQSDRIFDWDLRVGLPLRESVVGYVGFRYLQFDTRPGDRELDNQVHVGIRWIMGKSD